MPGNLKLLPGTGCTGKTCVAHLFPNKGNIAFHTAFNVPNAILDGRL